MIATNEKREKERERGIESATGRGSPPVLIRFCLRAVLFCCGNKRTGVAPQQTHTHMDGVADIKRPFLVRRSVRIIQSAIKRPLLQTGRLAVYVSRPRAIPKPSTHTHKNKKSETEMPGIVELNS